MSRNVVTVTAIGIDYHGFTFVKTGESFRSHQCGLSASLRNASLGPRRGALVTSSMRLLVQSARLAQSTRPPKPPKPPVPPLKPCLTAARRRQRRRGLSLPARGRRAGGRRTRGWRARGRACPSRRFGWVPVSYTHLTLPTNREVEI